MYEEQPQKWAYVWASTAEKARELCHVSPDSEVRLEKAAKGGVPPRWAVQISAEPHVSPEDFHRAGYLLDTGRNMVSGSWTNAELKLVIYTLERIIAWLEGAKYASTGITGPLGIELASFRGMLALREDNAENEVADYPPGWLFGKTAQGRKP